MTRAITCTTRAPRAGEKDGVDYHFFTAGEFLKRLQAGNFLEHATVYGNSYGILKSELLGKLREGKDVLLNVDVQGAATIREQAEERAGIEARAGDDFPDAAVGGRAGTAAEETRRGCGARSSKSGWPWRGRKSRSGRISTTC